MKRILFVLAALLLIGVQLLPSFVVPASAAEVVENVQADLWINALDYNTFMSNHGNTYYNQSIFSDLKVPIVTDAPIYDVDIVFQTNASNPVLSVFTSSSSWQLTTQIIENGRTYRAFGRVPGIGNSGSQNGVPFLGFRLTSSSGNYISFLQVNYTTTNAYRFSAPLSADFKYNNSANYHFAYNGSSTASYIPPVVTDLEKTGFSFFINLDSWKSFDYMDIILYCQSCTISSIGAVFDDQSIPFSVNEIIGTNTIRDSVYISVRVDLRGLKRNTTSTPYLIISGSTYVNVVSSYAILEGSGLVITQDINPLYYYFKSIKDSISLGTKDIVNALGSAFAGNGQGAAIKDQVSGKTETFDDILGGLNSGVAADRPDSSDISSSLDISGVLSPTAITTSTGFLTAVFDVPTLSKLLSLTLIFALAATILFGKR